MAYNKHPLKASESHYNKPALVTILLIFLGIMILVAVRQFSPEMGANLGITSTAQASPVVIPKAAPAVVETKVKLSSNVKEQPPKAAENISSTQNTDSVSCTEKDISAGLCK
jgi:hypothetical protein